MKNKKYIVELLIVIILINLVPVDILAGGNSDIITEVSTSKETLKNGQKNVDYNISNISFKNNKDYTLDRDRFDINNLHKVIKIMVNGALESPIDSKGNSRYDISYDEVNNKLEIRIKEGESDGSHLKPFILKKHKHYNISIPAGFYKYGNSKNEEINFNFVTRGDGKYGQDILNSTDPESLGTEIDYGESKIKFHFIDRIKINDNIGNQHRDLFKISSKSKINPNSNNYEEVEENLDNYHVFVEGNTLIFRRKNGQLNDYAEYKVSIKKNAIVLLNSTNRPNIEEILNNEINVNFDTDEWILSTYPKNNQGMGNEEKVERNPLIKFKFKYPVELVDSSKIEISSDGADYAVGLDSDTWITYDDNTLKIDINSVYREGKNPLRANTAYKIKLGKGSLKLKKHKENETGKDVFNEDIFLYFTTGTKIIESNEGFKTSKYSTEGKSDNIVELSTSELAKDGNILVEFNKKIKWNKWTSDPKVTNAKEALKYFKLYKLPSAYKRDYNGKGITYDKEFRYNSSGESLPLKEKDEIVIKSVEIVDGNKIKITPKYDLIPYNNYEIKLVNKDIITNDDEEVLGATDSLVKGQTIWTDKEGKVTPKWDMEMISAEEIIEVEKAPTEGQNGSIILHGAPNYNSKIDETDGKPLILYVDSEVVPDPSKIKKDGNIIEGRSLVDGISMIEGFREDDPDSKKQGIKFYQLEYIEDQGRKKTKISIYPDSELKSGRYYELKIKNNVFYSRSGINLTGLDIKFVVEGDNTSDRRIDKLEVVNKDEFTLITGERKFARTDFQSDKPNIKFNIIGYNFAEDIKQVRFVREIDGKTIIVPKNDLKFEDVTKITGEIKGNIKAKFAESMTSGECGNTTRNTGIYAVYVDFEKGKSAAPINESSTSTKISIKDRPMVIDTFPKNNQELVNIQDMYMSIGGDEAYYVKVELEKVDGSFEFLPYNGVGLGAISTNNQTILSRVSIKEIGDTLNLVNSAIGLKIEDNVLYIPFEGIPDENIQYNIEIKENLLRYRDLTKWNYKDELDEYSNLCYNFNFKTNYIPNVKSEGLYDGSLAENYDYNYPIVIEGSDFNSRTRVRFKNTGNGKYYDADSITREDERIYVFLPGRRDRLPIGQYDIEISNGPNYDVFLQFGILSIVEEGKHIPNENYFIREDDYYGEVKADTKTSSDTLELDRRERDRGYLRLNLDELMGEDTWSRSLEYPVSRSENISLLNLESVWADIELSNVRLSILNNENVIRLRVGRVSPVKSDNFKMQLMDRNIKSEFIEVDGENFDFDLVKIKIPYERSDSGNLEMLKYDEFLRKFIPVPSIVNKVDKTVESTTRGKGIFVIVE